MDVYLKELEANWHVIIVEQHNARTTATSQPACLDPPASQEELSRMQTYVARQHEIKASMAALEQEKRFIRQELQRLPHPHDYELICVDFCKDSELLHRFQCRVCQRIEPCMCDMCMAPMHCLG